MDTEDAIELLAAAPAIAYREYLYRPDGQLASWIDRRFDVVARPGQPTGQRVQEGDVLLEVELGRISPGRYAILSARDLQLMVPGQRLAHGRLLLRPRRRMEMSEPLPVEPAVQDNIIDAAGAEYESGDDSSTQGGQLVLRSQSKPTPPGAATGTEAEPFTGQDESEDLGYLQDLEHLEDVEDLEVLEDLEGLIGGGAAEYMQHLMTEAALRGELLLDTPSPAPPLTSPSILANGISFTDGRGAVFAEQQPAAPAAATSVDVTVRTDFAVSTAAGVRFDWAGGEQVPGARAQIMGTGVSAVSDVHGNLRLNTTGLDNGFYTIRIEHTNADKNSPDIAGPTIADSLATPPSRIYRPLHVWVAIVDGHITAAMVALFSPHGGIGNRQHATWDATHLPIDWKPTWMRSPMKITEAPRSTTTVDLVVVHRPDRSDIGPAINTFLSASEEGNAHYLIDHNGHIIKMAEDGRKANHTGFSLWRGNRSLNAISIGIEVMRAPDGFSPAAMAALAALIERLRTAHPTIPAHRVVGHSDIATSKAHPTLLSDRRLEDPGHQFDWALLERQGLGMVPGPVAAATTAYSGIFAAGQPAVVLRNGDHDPNEAAPATLGGTAQPGFVGNPVGELQADLEHIGYSVRPVGGLLGRFDAHTVAAVDRFQRHFFSGSRENLRPALGEVDVLTAGWIHAVRSAIP